jgi:beta-N-acetylhexosaminidase
MDEMRGIVSRAKPLEGVAKRRAERALASIKKPDDSRETDLRAEFAEYFEAVA